MRILITDINGSSDPSGRVRQDLTFFEYDRGTDPPLLNGYCWEADFVFHLARVNRPKES